MIVGAPQSPNNVSSTFFNTVHLFPKDLKISGSNKGAPNLLLAQGASYSHYAPFNQEISFIKKLIHSL